MTNPEGTAVMDHNTMIAVDLPEFDIGTNAEKLELHPWLAQKVLAEWSNAPTDDDNNVDLHSPCQHYAAPTTTHAAWEMLDDGHDLLLNGSLSPTSVLDDGLLFSAALDDEEVQLLCYPMDNTTSNRASDNFQSNYTEMQAEKDDAALSSKNLKRKEVKGVRKSTGKPNKQPSKRAATSTKESPAATANSADSVASKWHQLHLSIQRSQETRKSLQMTTEQYGRQQTVTQVLRSIEQSTRKLQELCLHNPGRSDEDATTKRKRKAPTKLKLSRKKQVALKQNKAVMQRRS